MCVDDLPLFSNSSFNIIFWLHAERQKLFLNSSLSRFIQGSRWSGVRRTFHLITEDKRTESSQRVWESSESAVYCTFFQFNRVTPSDPVLCYKCGAHSECMSTCAHCGAGVYQQAAHRRLSLFSFYHLTFRRWGSSACVWVYRCERCSVCVCIHPGLWEGERWGGGGRHLKVTWEGGEEWREAPAILWMAISNMSPVTHLQLLATKRF